MYMLMFHLGNQPGQFQTISDFFELPSTSPSTYASQASLPSISQFPEALAPQQPQLLTAEDVNSDSNLFLKSFRKMTGNSTIFILLQPIITTPIQLQLNIPYRTNGEPHNVYGLNLPQEINKQFTKSEAIPEITRELLPPRLNYDYSAPLPSLTTGSSFYDPLTF